MTCSQLRHLLELNPLSHLGATELDDTRSHASMCPTCSEVLESVAKLEQELTDLPEIDVRTELCDRVMESISTREPTPTANPETGRTLFAQFLNNLSFVLATVALVTGINGTQWLRNSLSFDAAFKLEETLTNPSLSTSAGLSAVACLLCLAALALSEGTSSRSGPVTSGPAPPS